MKVFFTFVLAIFAILESVFALPVVQDEPVNKRWPIPQLDGSVRWMTRGEAIFEAMFSEPQDAINPRKLDKVRFYLYTQGNPTTPVELDMENTETLVRSGFNFKNPTRFIVHGWNGGWNGGENRLIREALLLNGEGKDYNIISVDWSVYGESLTYITSQRSCSKAGVIVAAFIDWLHDYAKLQFDTLALYGHSLGAHVVGFAGKNVQRGRVHTIIGLDTAMPLFRYNNADSRLADTDAEYVESIQTNGERLGFYKPIGQAAFYPNGGKFQPGCGLDLSGGCAHGRSVHYLAEALSRGEQNELNAVKCGALENVEDRSCNIYEGGVRLGDPNNAGNARGIYYLETNSSSLFGIGNVY